MSDVLRSTTFQLAFNGNDGLTGIRTFTKSVRDADAVVKELNDRLGQNATATYKTVQSKKELEQQARLIANQMERNAKRTDELSRSLQHQISIIGKSSEQQAAMTAAFSLGSTATDEQRNKVAQLAAQLTLIQSEERAVIEASNARITAQAELNRQIEKAEQAHKELSDELRRQISITGESNEKQEISNNLKRLGSNATDQQRRSIIELTNRLTRLKAEQAALAEAEKIANQEKQRAAANTQKLTQQYQLMASMVRKSADEIEQLNAVQALGSRATDAQRQQVLQAVQKYQELRNAVDGSQGSLRGFRGQMQNVGWQVQDTVVQLQMGTNAFVVLSQQGSQFLSGFGPKGAIAGAALAVAGVFGGALYQAFNSAAGALDKLDQLTKEYNKTLTVSNEGVVELTSYMEELSRYSTLSADAQLRLARNKVFQSQTESIKSAASALAEFNSGFSGTVDIGKKAQNLGLLPDEFAELQFSINSLNQGVTREKLERYVKAISAMTPELKNAKEGAGEVKQALLDQFYTLARGQTILDQTTDGWKEHSKGVKTASDEIIKNFESEYNSLVKQTENIEQEYARRKANIDAYVTTNADEEAKQAEAYVLLEQWKTDELKKEDDKRAAVIIRAFQNQYNSLVKQTETIDQEYERRKADLTAYVSEKGEIDDQAANAFIALEQWKTNEYQKETDKRIKEADRRDKILRQIEKGQVRQFTGGGDVDAARGAENEMYLNNIRTLVDEKIALKEHELAENIRIDTLLANEAKRHNQVMSDLDLESYQNNVALVGMAVTQVDSLVNLMSTGVETVKSQTREMNSFQKATFLTMQAIAAATALINGIEMGAILAKNKAVLDFTGLSSAAMLAFGTSVGAANAGAIMGTTIAGAFDKGGDVPAGQFGIVSEYGDELVNGMLVKGPARVTSRKETERMMSGGATTAVSLKVNIDNQIPNAQYDVQQLSADEVRIIARQEFNKNIDQGVSSALANPNSKTAKSMRRNYKAPSRL